MNMSLSELPLIGNIKKVQTEQDKKRGFSNQVFVELDKNGKQKVFYLPVYMRLNIKNFTKLCLQTLDSEMHATIVLTVYYDTLHPIIVEQIKNNIVLQFNRDDPIRLIKNGLDIVMKHDDSQRMIHYTIRRRFTMRILADVFLSPFELISLLLTITLQTVDIYKLKGEGQKQQYSQQKLCEVKFNLMTTDDSWTKISYSKEGTFGIYDLAEKKLKSEFTSNKSPQQIMKMSERLAETKVKNMQYAHYTIPLYKYPGSSVASIFLPLFLLAMINLCIFFQQNNTADRVASISALAIAFVSLVPTIRKQIPPTPKITFVQILVFIEAFTSFLCLVQTFIDLNEEATVFQFSDQILLFICTVLTFGGFIVVLGMFIMHKKVWQKQYNDQPKDQDIRFNSDLWFNKISDEMFQKAVQTKKLSLLRQIPA